ncbi:MAG: hypothetical protein OEO77_08780 [Acidimicrobiia bacterium]|nr:hypothetical protein [Acidimicrobiia bacterium]
MIDRWRLWAAGALLGTMAVVLVWAVVDRSGDRSTTLPETATTTSVESPTGLPTTLPSDDAAAVESALEATLTAWGAFAVTGDLALLAPHVAAHGPRMATFAEEAAVLVADPIGPPDYSVIIDAGEVLVVDDTASTDRTVTFRRPGELDQVYRWMFTFRLIDDRWQLWSVTDETS